MGLIANQHCSRDGIHDTWGFKKQGPWKKSLHALKLQKSHLAAGTSIGGYIEK